MDEDQTLAALEKELAELEQQAQEAVASQPETPAIEPPAPPVKEDKPKKVKKSADPAPGPVEQKKALQRPIFAAERLRARRVR